MTAPERIWARSSKCERGGRDPFGDFRLTKIEKPDWHDRHRYHDQEEYIRADLHDATKAQLAKAVEALRFYAGSPMAGNAYLAPGTDNGSTACDVLAEIEKGGV